MKILVTGANGLLGQYLIKLLLENNYHVLGIGKGPSRLNFSESNFFSYADTDITDSTAVNRLFRTEMPEIVIHTAAMTQVDHCEQNQGLCQDINVGGTSNIIMHSRNCCRFIIYLSTDFVFDGQKGNYEEEDDLNPVNWYGLTKLRAEKLVEQGKIPYAIIRTCLVYGNSIDGTRKNIVSWVKENLEREIKIKVVDDQIRTPTYVGDLANGILLLCKHRLQGIFHISGEEILTPYEMAIRTAAYFQFDKGLIERVNADVFSQPAKRPLKTGFKIDKVKRELGYKPVNFDMGLQKMYSIALKAGRD